MDFAFTPDELALRDHVIAFCRKHLRREEVERRDAAGEFGAEAWRLLAGQGVLGANIDEAFGGAGLGVRAGVLVMEALGYACEDLGLAFSIAAHVYACALAIQKFGSAEQKQAYLPRLASGEWIAAHSITEPEAGSDVFAQKTRAVLRGDDYVLDGGKCFTTNAPVAGLFLVQAVTAPGRGFFGLSAFLVEAGTKGLRVGRPHEKIGLRTSPTADIYFDECVVPASARLGPESAGAPIFTYSMAWERTCLFAIYVGAMARQVEDTIAFAKQRRQFGQPIGKFQAVSHRIVDMKVRLEAARLLLHRAAWKLSNGIEDPLDAAMAKLFVSEAAVQTGLDAIQLRGGMGVVTGPAERFLRDAIPSRVFSGTSEIQKNNIARALGL